MATAEDIANAIDLRLQKIRTLDGYRTDAGANLIFRGIETPDRNHPMPQLSIFIPAEETDRQRGNCHHRDMEGSFLIAGWVKPLTTDSLQPLLDLLADIKRAVFKYGDVPEITALVKDHKYAGCDFVPRRDGSTFSQLVVEGVFKWREDI